MLARAGTRADEIRHLTGGESDSLKHTTIERHMTFAREEELAAKVRIVLALSIEAGVILEGARKDICAVSDTGPLFEGTGRHRQRDAIAAPDRSSAVVSRACVDATAAWTVLEQLVDFLGGHANMSEGAAINLAVVFTREAKGRYIIGIIDAAVGIAGGRSDGERCRKDERMREFHCWCRRWDELNVMCCGGLTKGECLFCTIVTMCTKSSGCEQWHLTSK